MAENARKSSFKKSLRKATHPIPSEKVEKDKSKYDRKQIKKGTKSEIDRDIRE